MRGTIRLVLSICFGLFVGSPAIAQQTPERSEHYKPFSITSAKLSKEMTGEYIESELMCRKTTDKMVEHLDLIQNYDALSSGGDHSVAIQEFAGLQEGSPAIVQLVVTKPDLILRYVLVNDEYMLTCGY